jgi:hypothetical protein
LLSHTPTQKRPSALPPSRSFKLFLHTKLSNPHYPPEIQAETTLINFTVTEQARLGIAFLTLSLMAVGLAY